MDEPIGRLLNWLSQQTVYDNTIIALLSTHGADFDRASNGPSPYQPQVQVPISIRIPGVEPVKVNRPVQLSDFPKTVSRFVPFEPEADWARCALSGL